MNLKAIIVTGLIFTSSICQADDQEYYAVDKEYSLYRDGTEILINKDSLATVKAGIDNDEIAEIFISPKDKNNISHNKYDTFRVDEGGIILNNIQVKADYIINEVINNGPTSLIEGNIDIKGQAAHVIIANPNGIICDDCSFSNTLSETLVSGSIHRPNNSVAIYNTTALPYSSSSASSKFNSNRGKINIINSKNINSNAMYNQLNIISNGMMINNKIISSKNVNLFNNHNVVHHFNNTLAIHVPTTPIRNLPTLNWNIRKSPKLPSNNYLLIGNKNNTTTPLNQNGNIHSDSKINIYANNSQVKNYGYLISEMMHLSLSKNTKFENYNFISTGKLTLDNDNTSKIINMESGYINHYLPYIFDSYSSAYEIDNNKINNKERIRINNLINNNYFINKGIFHVVSLKRTH